MIQAVRVAAVQVAMDLPSGQNHQRQLGRLLNPPFELVTVADDESEESITGTAQNNNSPPIPVQLA